jgi:hypothetical protein
VALIVMFCIPDGSNIAKNFLTHAFVAGCWRPSQLPLKASMRLNRLLLAALL